MACWVTLRKKVMEETQTVIVNLDHVKVIERFVMGDEHLGGNNSMFIFNYVHDGYDFLHVVETQEAILKEMLLQKEKQKSWEG
jgi:allantoicase